MESSAPSGNLDLSGLGEKTSANQILCHQWVVRQKNVPSLEKRRCALGGFQKWVELPVAKKEEKKLRSIIVPAGGTKVWLQIFTSRFNLPFRLSEFDSFSCRMKLGPWLE